MCQCLKINLADWIDGTAVYYALNFEILNTSLTSILKNMPNLMEWLTHYTFYLEKFGFVLLFIPFAWQYFRLI